MTLIEIKKDLYRDKFNLAMFQKAVAGKLRYIRHSPNKPDVLFAVPFDEIGETAFNSAVEARLLIRYIVQPETT